MDWMAANSTDPLAKGAIVFALVFDRRATEVVAP
jgi:hypothetical protein